MKDRHVPLSISPISDFSCPCSKRASFRGTPLLAFMLVASCLVRFCAAADVPEDLPACPIMPENQASSEFYADYNGLRYYFCCDSCVNDFNSDPSRFTSLASTRGFPIPGIDASNPESELDDSEYDYAPQEGFFERCVSSFFAVKRWLNRRYNDAHLDRPFVRLHLFAIVLLVCVLCWRWRVRRSATWASSAGWMLAVLALGNAMYWSWVTVETQEARLRAEQQAAKANARLRAFDDEVLEHEVHYSTFFDYGFPPRPRSDGKENSLSVTYYRGNDERSAKMFNGGQYRTVTLHVGLETDDGQPIRFGQEIDDEPIFIKVVFVRSADTSSGYYTREYMARMYLTMQAERFNGRTAPVADRVPWTETEPGVVWGARYRLPDGDAFPQEWLVDDPYGSDDDRRRGVVYLCEDRILHDVVAGGRFHYGIEYDLRIQDGVVAPESNLFMGSTYSGRNFTRYRITDEQWLSREPIPEKPL